MRIIHKRDLIPLTIIQGLIYFFLLVLRPTHLISTTLVYFIPVGYLFLRLKHEKIKLVIFSFLIALFGFGIIDVLAVAGHSWAVQQIIPFRYLNYSYWENIIWSFGFSLYVLFLYKHFIEPDKNRKISKNWKQLFIIILSVNLILYFGFISKGIPSLYYAYLIIGLVSVVPFFIILTRQNSHILKESMPVVIYVFVNSLIYELIALYIGNWWFPGNFVGSISLLKLHFPLEELIFWIALSTPTLIEIYNHFVEEKA